MTTCKHCERDIECVEGRWVDPEATGDDSIWRETCDAHDTFMAEHEPNDPYNELREHSRRLLHHVSEPIGEKAGSFTCDEAESMRDLFLLVGLDDHAEDFMRAHADGDNEEDDRHAGQADNESWDWRA